VLPTRIVLSPVFCSTLAKAVRIEEKWRFYQCFPNLGSYELSRPLVRNAKDLEKLSKNICFNDNKGKTCLAANQPFFHNHTEEYPFLGSMGAWPNL
jgi:hypothetical protein